MSFSIWRNTTSCTLNILLTTQHLGNLMDCICVWGWVCERVCVCTYNVFVYLQYVCVDIGSRATQNCTWNTKTMIFILHYDIITQTMIALWCHNGSERLYEQVRTAAQLIRRLTPESEDYLLQERTGPERKTQLGEWDELSEGESYGGLQAVAPPSHLPWLKSTHFYIYILHF